MLLPRIMVVVAVSKCVLVSFEVWFSKVSNHRPIIIVLVVLSPCGTVWSPIVEVCAPFVLDVMFLEPCVPNVPMRHGGESPMLLVDVPIDLMFSKEVLILPSTDSYCRQIQYGCGFVSSGIEQEIHPLHFHWLFLSVFH
uniref:Uncharacterized protein n=1 Tax=Cacopsylla melanoneura TaxID=428564 RepID=A0A8D8S750_9HEMI